MSIIEHGRGFLVLSHVDLLERDEEIETAAWYTAAAAALGRRDKALLVGRYVEAGRPNLNRHVFRAEDLPKAKDSLMGAPLNINHNQRRTVGTYLGADVMYPLGSLSVSEASAAAAGSVTSGAMAIEMTVGGNGGGNVGGVGGGSGGAGGMAVGAGEPAIPPRRAAVGGAPWLETLAAVWKKAMPDEYALMRQQQAEGGLTQSMEAMPEALICSGDKGCGRQFPYDGIISAQYCEHLQQGVSDKVLVNPYFVGGAVIMAPARPGWPDARISMTSSQGQDFERLCAAMANELQGFTSDQVRLVANTLVAPTMAEIEDLTLADLDDEFATMKAKLLAEYGWAEVMWGRTFSMPMRMKLAKQGLAMPDGSYPIVNIQDLKNAIQAIGRAAAGKRGAVISFIKRRAKALGVPKMAENLSAEDDARKRKPAKPAKPAKMPMNMPNMPMNMPNADEDAAKNKGKGGVKQAC